jgi:hypothetical protein
VWIAGTEALVLSALTAYTSLDLARCAGADLSLDVLGPNEARARSIGTTRWVQSHNPFDFEIKLLDKSFGQDSAASLQGDGKLAASWWEQLGVLNGTDEEFEDVDCNWVGDRMRWVRKVWNELV